MNRKVINELKLKRMATKIRLARHGRKGRPFYHVVVADSRAPRDGRYIERIGSYNPMTNPATIDLNFDRALYWLMTGAQPTDTAKRILSYEGVLMKKHLLEGVKKGAFDMAAADTKFEAWKKEKIAKIQAKIARLANESESAYKARLEAEAKVKEAKAEIVAKKQAEIAAAKAEADGKSGRISLRTWVPGFPCPHGGQYRETGAAGGRSAPASGKPGEDRGRTPQRL